METLAEELRQFVVDNFLFGRDNGKFGDDSSFMDTGVIDSTGVLELVGFVEDKYGIKIEDDELIPENLDSIDNLSRFIQAKLGA